MKKLRKALVVLIVLLMATELVARFILGLGKMPVYIEDKDYEYIYAPNQDVKRFGNRILTNELSMRSKPLSKKDRLRILKFGDSVINGGSQTTHDSLASTILENTLSKEFHDSIRVLNIGANSWGPGNAFAYLKKHGDLGASMIVLVFSSHDLKDNMHFKKVVGVHPAWPAEQPLTATGDGFSKYVMPWLRRKLDKNYNEYDYLDNTDQTSVNEGWKSFIDYSKEHKIPLLVYLHASKKEVQNNRYEANGDSIMRMLDSAGVEYIQGLKFINDESCFRDHIHLNEKGQRKLAEALLPRLGQHVKAELAHNP